MIVQRLRLFTSGYVAVGLLLAALVCGGCGRPPQMADDPECFSAVDALWTAIGSRKSDLLADSEARIKALHDKQSLGDPSYEVLAQVIDQAKTGEWSAARAKLRKFMEGQRRGR